MKPDALLEIGKGEEKSAQEILDNLAENFCLNDSDIKYILDKTPVILNQKKFSPENLFASIALFVRCSKSKVPPMSYKLFLEIIDFKGYKVIKKSFMRGIKRLKKEKIYPLYCRISVFDMLDTYTPFIKEKLELDEKVIVKAKKILERASAECISEGRSPVSKIAVALYIAAILSGEHRTQKEVSEVMGVSEVTIREIYRELSDGLDIDVFL